MTGPGRILVVGAGAPLGLRIAELLRARGLFVTGAYRTPGPGVETRILAAGAAALRLELGDTAGLKAQMAAHDAAIFTPILTASLAAAGHLRPDQPALFFSSNNVAVVPQEPLYAQLLRAEGQVRDQAPQAVILRPTMIYGHPRDGNLSRLMRAARRWPVLPCPGAGALQQPIFHADLAAVAVDALLDPDRVGETAAVAGPEAVSRRALYRAVCRAAGRHPPIVPVAVPLALWAANMARKAGRDLPLDVAQLRRARLDKRPVGSGRILTGTPLAQGLATLAAALDAEAGQADGSSAS